MVDFRGLKVVPSTNQALPAEADTAKANI